MSDGARSTTRRRRALLGDRLAVVMLCAATYGPFLSIGLVGHDSYPVIAASRVHSLADLAGTFTEELMDGRFRYHYYRPVLNLTVAFDERFSGLEARGYQVSNLLWFIAATLAIHALAYRLSGEDRLAASVAAVVYLLHVVHCAVVPVLARRPETLSTLFMALAVWAQVRATREDRRSLAPAAFALAAMGSKEPGFLAVPLVVLAASVHRPHDDRGRWLRGLARDAAPVVAASLGAFALRTRVLGGVGGPSGAGLSNLPLAVDVLGTALFPQPFMPRSAAALAIVLALAAAPAVLVRARRPPLSGTARAGLLVAAAWTAASAGLYAYTGQIDPWYVSLPVAGIAMLTGIATGLLFGWIGTTVGTARAAAAAGLAALLGLAAWQARYSVLLHRYDEWPRADRELRDCLDDLAPRLAGAVPGTVVRTRPVARWILPRTDGPTIRGTAVILDYGLQAWADLRVPDRVVRVRSPEQLAQARADEVTLVPVWKLP